jgi:hypothetical protein
VGHPRSLRSDRVKRSLGFALLFRPTYAEANVGTRPVPSDSYESYSMVRPLDPPRFLVPYVFRAVEIGIKVKSL